MEGLLALSAARRGRSLWSRVRRYDWKDPIVLGDSYRNSIRARETTLGDPCRGAHSGARAAWDVRDVRFLLRCRPGSRGILSAVVRRRRLPCSAVKPRLAAAALVLWPWSPPASSRYRVLGRVAELGSSLTLGSF